MWIRNVRIRNETLDFAMPPYGGAPNPCKKTKNKKSEALAENFVFLLHREGV